MSFWLITWFNPNVTYNLLFGSPIPSILMTLWLWRASTLVYLRLSWMLSSGLHSTMTYLQLCRAFDSYLPLTLQVGLPSHASQYTGLSSSRFSDFFDSTKPSTIERSTLQSLWLWLTCDSAKPFHIYSFSKIWEIELIRVIFTIFLVNILYNLQWKQI